jgi:hypothetical protein
MALKDLARRAARRVTRRRPAPNPRREWSRVEDNPTDAVPLADFRFFAVLGTWMEADVVEACIDNARTQGVERVFLVDNDSPDDTVARAAAAGATVSRTFGTESYDELLRMRLMSDVVDEVSRADGAEHIWWLWLDADEFAHGPGGRTLRDHLATLDHRFRIVGTRYLNHYPSGAPQNVPGRHPIDYQPLCEELRWRFCTQGHRKHPLQRWDRNGPPIECGPGFHKASSTELLLEPSDGAFLHHFPFRDEALSRARLDVLCGGDGAGGRGHEGDPATDHMLARFRSLEAVYAQRWAEVDNFMPGAGLGVSVVPWDELVDVEDRRISRWYPEGANDDA